MSFKPRIPALAVFAALLAAPAFAAPAPADTPPIVGRWDITVTAGDTYPCWLGVEVKDGKLAGQFLHRAGSVNNLKEIKFENGMVSFEYDGKNWTGPVKSDVIDGTWSKGGEKGAWKGKRYTPVPDVAGIWNLTVPEADKKAVLRLRSERPGQIAGRLRYENAEGRGLEITNAVLIGNTLGFSAGEDKFEAQIKGDILEGSKPNRFTAVRARRWGQPIELFNGKDLANWEDLDKNSGGKTSWKVADGIMTNGGEHTVNIVTKDKSFRDFKLHVEFRVPKDGNSGVYCRGRYEVQVADSAGRPLEPGMCGALYSRVIPSKNACKPAGEWQAFDITLIGQHITVVLNGETIVDNQEVAGITGGAIDANEELPGPIYLQGDHSMIEYRKVTLTPAQPAGAATRPGRRG